MVKRYNCLPKPYQFFTPDMINKLKIAEEEKRIRANPLQTGSAILSKVFGG